MSRDIRRKSYGDDGSKDELQEQIDAAFEVFWLDYAAKSAVLSSPHISDVVKAISQQATKEIFSAGFSAAYGSYIVAMHVLKK